MAEAPSLIGPHEGRECSLMLAGQKPFAMFCDALGFCHHFPEQDFRPYVELGLILRREETYSIEGERSIRCVYYCRPGEEWRMDAAHRLKIELYSKRRPWSDADDARFGYLLGYSEAEIEAFQLQVRSARGSA